MREKQKSKSFRPSFVSEIQDRIIWKVIGQSYLSTKSMGAFEDAGCSSDAACGLDVIGSLWFRGQFRTRQLEGQSMHIWLCVFSVI